MPDTIDRDKRHCLDLTGLSRDTASFTAEGLFFQMPIAEWQDLGKPTSLWVRFSTTVRGISYGN